MRRFLVWVATLAMTMVLGCGGPTASSTGTGAASGSGGAGGTTASSGSGASMTMSGCVEPVPMGYPDAYTGWNGPVANGNALADAPDEVNKGKGSAAGAVRFTFVCPHDFTAVGVDYDDGMLGGFTFTTPATVRVSVLPDKNGLPDGAPFPPGGAAMHAQCFPADPNTTCVTVPSDSAIRVPLAFHVNAGDSVWAAGELFDDSAAMAVSEAGAPDTSRSAFFSPPGSSEGGPAGTWRLLSKPPAGLTPIFHAPIILLVPSN